MDEDELRRRWAATLGGDPGSPEYDVATTFRLPDPGSGAASAQPRAWDGLLSRFSDDDEGDQEALLTTLQGPPGSPPATEEPSPPPIAGGSGFELHDVLGRGGMGVVFRAVQTSLQREVAVKKLHGGRATPGQEARFVAEAMVAGLLDHPNVVPVHDLGRTGRGELAIAMKLARGPSWRRLLHPESDEERARAASMDLRAHLEVFLAVCNAAAYAHSKGVAHLDLKPENVLVGEFGEVLVMDWGLAVALDPALERPGLPHHTAVRTPCGTPAYMPPELAEGDGGRIGPWTDVYLLGATLFEVVTGAPPHRRRTVSESVLAAARGEVPEPGPSTPAGLREVIVRALAPRPEDRFEGVAALRAAVVEHLRHGESARVADDARRVLEAAVGDVAASPAERYGRFAEAVAGFRQARLLWAGNEAARRGEAEARRAYALAALEAGDLALARAQATSLDVAGDLLARVEAAEAARAAAARSARRARRALAGAVGVIAAGLVTGGALLDAARRRAEAGEAAARAQEALARASEEAARAAKVEAEGRLADGLLAEGRALGGAGAWERGRERLRDARALLERLERPTLPADLALLGAWHEAPEALLEVRAHAAPVTAVALAAEADLLVCGAADGRLRVLERRTGRLRHDVAGHDGAVLALSASLDGRRALSGGADGRVRLWDLDAGRAVATLDGHDGPVRAVALAPLGARAASGGDDATLRGWDLDALAPVSTTRLAAPVAAVALSWDGTYAAAGAGREVRVVHLAAGSRFDGHTVHAADVTCVALDHGRVLSGDAEGALYARDLRSGAVTRVGAHTGAARAVAFEEEPGHALSLGDDGTLRRWDVPEAREVGRRAVPPPASAALAPALGRALTGHPDGLVRVHDLARGLPGGHEALDLPGPPAHAVGVDPRGEVLLLATEGGDARVIDAASGRPLVDLAGHARPVTAVDVVATPAGPRGLTVGEDGALVLWDLARGLPLRRVTGEAPLRCARLTPDAARALAGDAEGSLRAWDLATGREVLRLDLHPAPVAALALDGDRVVTGDDQGTLVVTALAPTRVLSTHVERPVALRALAVEGDLVLAGAADGWLFARDLVADVTRWSVRAHTGAVAGLALSGGGAVFSAGADGTVALWRLADGANLGALPAGAPARALAVTPDGRRALVGTDAGARLWDVERVARRERLRPSPVLGAVVDPAARAAWCALVGAGDDAAALLHADEAAGATDDLLLLADLLPEQWARGRLVDAARAAARLAAAAPDDPLAAARLDAVRRDEREQGGGLVGREPDIVRGLAFTPDGARLVSISRRGTLTVWHTLAGAPLRRLRQPARDLFALALVDGGRVAWVGDADGRLVAWDLASGAPAATARHGEEVTCAVTLPDGRVATGGQGGVRRWRLDGAEAAGPALAPGERARGLAVTADGRRLAVLTRDGASLWDLEAGARLGDLEGAPARLDQVVALPDGGLLGATARALVRWAPGDLVAAQTIPHPTSTYALAVSPDGRRALTGASDGVVRLWDLTRGAEVRAVALPALALVAAWSPRGDVVAVGLRDGQVRALRVD
ncbi:MAG: protein kinase [Planctomycetes bacterium]|nr:protein kinase [Planctomycetota bacterium]